MDSSTSHFDFRHRVHAALLLLTAVTAWGVCIFYTLRLNPEVKYYVQGAVIKNRWAEKMTREHGSKILIYGGSSCAFSIDGERLLNRFNLPTVNYGLGAGIGPTVLTESVLDEIRPGDTLIVAIEPGLLTDPLDPPALGVQFSFAMHHPEWVVHPIFNVPSLNLFQAVASLRPGGFHTFTLLGKIARGRPLMRYHESNYRPSGWEQTNVRIKIDGPAGHGPRLSGDTRVLLHDLRAWCDQRNVRIAYSLPWSYTPAEKEPSFQKGNADFLLQVNEFIPVLKDTHLGADTDIEHFADTVWHLNGIGSALRTDELGEQIKNWNIWTVEELRLRESQL
jgi:hypothetical protein